MPSITTTTLVVFFGPQSGSSPVDDLVAGTLERLGEVLGEPLLTEAMTYASRSLLFKVVDIKELPPLPVSLLRHTGLDELAERKLGGATRAVMLGAPASNRPPYPGLWTVLAVSHLLSKAAGGVAFDPAASRILRPVAGKPLTNSGAIAVSEHVIVPFSIGERGLGWMTTTGMVKFGLPELEIRDIPPGLDDLARLVNAMGQCLLDLVATSVDTDSSAGVLNVPAEVSLTHRHVAAAYGRPATTDSEASRRASVGVEYRAAAKGQPPFLRLVRPAGFSKSHGEWLYQALKDLLGSAGEMRNVQASSEAMQAAHVRALAELGAVKARFQRGLRPGETLYLKHGFEVGGGRREFMWIVVKTWTDKQIGGQLANDARGMAALKAGRDVQLEESQVFDWLIKLPGGEEDGGYTTKVALSEGLRDAGPHV